MRDDGRELSGQGLWIGRARCFLAAPDESRGEAGGCAAEAGIAAEHDVALINVALKHRVEIVRRRWRIEIGKLNRRKDVFDRRQRVAFRGAAGQVADRKSVV